MKKGLIAILIAANLLMLVIGVFTIPPNLQAAAGRKPPAPGTKLTASITPPPKEEAPLTTPTPEEEAPRLYRAYPAAAFSYNRTIPVWRGLA